jgi:hypothetical protein
MQALFGQADVSSAANGGDLSENHREFSATNAFAGGARFAVRWLDIQ